MEIKRIEKPTNRQVTYSKRRGGIMKKAREITVLCDAEVSLLMFSNTGKLSEYCSPSTNTKKIFDRYQQVTGINLWKSHYEKMQNHLNKLKEENNMLRKEIRQMMGEELSNLDMNQLCGLEQNLNESLKVVRERKYHVIKTQTETSKKKLRSSHEVHTNLVRALEGRDANKHFNFGGNTGPQYESVLGLANGGVHDLHDVGFGFHDLRLD